MNRTLFAAFALAAVVCAPTFAAGMADYDSQFPAAVSQRSAQEVRSEAVVAAQHAADVDAKSKVAPRVKSALTREEVRQAAASANRAGTLPHGELSF